MKINEFDVDINMEILRYEKYHNASPSIREKY